VTVSTTTTIEAHGSGTLTAALLRTVLQDFPEDAVVHVRHEDSQQDGTFWNVRATVTGTSTPDDAAEPLAPACPNHQARQHRDGREPWCNECHLTEDGRTPVRLGGARFARQT
jgi:hypothetical protein